MRRVANCYTPFTLPLPVPAPVAVHVLRQPKVIVTANCGIDNKKVIDYKALLDRAIELSPNKPQSCIIYNRKYEQVRCRADLMSSVCLLFLLLPLISDVLFIARVALKETAGPERRMEVVRFW